MVKPKGDNHINTQIMEIVETSKRRPNVTLLSDLPILPIEPSRKLVRPELSRFFKLHPELKLHEYESSDARDVSLLMPTNTS